MKGAGSSLLFGLIVATMLFSPILLLLALLFVAGLGIAVGIDLISAIRGWGGGRGGGGGRRYWEPPR